MAKRVPGAKTMAEIDAALTPAERAAVKKRVKALELEEMSLADLRRAQEITQAELAAKLGLTQATVSQVESSTDVYLSTLDKHVAAMGGKLTLTATFKNRPPVAIAGFRRDGATGLPKMRKKKPVRGKATRPSAA